MGQALIAKAVFKSGKEKLAEAEGKTLFDQSAVDIDGNKIARLGDVVQGKKCIMVVNVASK